MKKLIAEHPQAAAYADNQIPDRGRALWKKAHVQNASPRAAIKAKCQHCVGYEDTVERIANCGTWRCPLWAYRPYQDKKD